MGAPSSALFSEDFLQCIEANQIYSLIQKHYILIHIKYINNILSSYDTAVTIIDIVLIESNQTHQKYRLL